MTPFNVIRRVFVKAPAAGSAALLLNPRVAGAADGSWLVDGAMPFEDLVAELALTPLPDQEEGAYQTLAGFVMTRLARVPRTGDRFAWGDLRFEVVDMDGRRVEKVLIERLPGVTSHGS